MGKFGKNSEPPKQADEKSKPPLPRPPRAEEDDFEDGDICTPKRDSTGNDDEPL